MMIVRHEKERRYAKFNTLLKEFECLETKSNARILNLWMKCFGQTGRREWMPNESPVELDYICQQWGDCPKNLHK